MSSFGKKAIDTIKYSFLTKRCKLCGEVIYQCEDYCDKCKNAPRIEGEICKKCGKSVDTCTCDKDKFTAEYDEICAPFTFDGSIAGGIVRFKNYGYLKLADSYADEMIASMKKHFESTDFDCVTYVPAHKLRKRRRGYNQSQVLAGKVAEKMNLPLEDLLVKITYTRHQRGSSATVRKKNVKGSFDLSYDVSAEGKSVLLIDDIKTTGSTLNECALTLVAYGARSVSCATVAIVDDSN